MTKEQFAEFGWQFKTEAFQSWVFQLGNYTLQFLHDKNVAYIAEDKPTDVQAQIIYRGRMENQDMLFDVMTLLFMPVEFEKHEPVEPQKEPEHRNLPLTL